MLRRLYCVLLRFHPVRFRSRFGEEMLSIFDAAASDANRVALLADAVFSLLRQWAVPSEYRQGAAEAALWSVDGSPAFYTFGDYKPSPSSLIAGTTLAAIVLCAVWLASQYTWTHPVFVPMATVQFEPKPNLGESESLDPRIPMNILSQYAGTYASSHPSGFIATVTAEDGRLAVQTTGKPKTRLVWVNGIAFKFLGSKTDWVTFVRYSQHPPYILIVCQAGNCVTAHFEKKLRAPAPEKKVHFH
jgi:hypothetical protein